MREILFRGKRVDNGEWVEGVSVEYLNKHYILAFYDDVYPDNNEQDRVYEYCPLKEMLSYKIIPESLGQYTGLDDKNGVKIFEGDILTSDVYLFKHNGKPNYNGEVYFDNEYDYCYKLILHCVNKNKRGISSGITELLSERGCCFEIIGNTTDNPNMLEVE